MKPDNNLLSPAVFLVDEPLSSHGYAYDAFARAIHLQATSTASRHAQYCVSINNTGHSATSSAPAMTTIYTYDCDSGISPWPSRYYYGYRYYSPSLGRWLSRDPMGERGGKNLYVFVRNVPINLYDLMGLTTVVEILNEFFSGTANDERLWIMGKDDEYTMRMRNWQPVKDAIQAAKSDLSMNCSTWETSHKTDPAWAPGRTDPPVTDQKAWPIWTDSPPGTDPVTAGRAYINYQLFGYVSDALWTSAIGSFGVYVTVDKINCSCKLAKLRVWMYNSMDQESFGDFTQYFPFSVMARQYMWWNWTEIYNWRTATSNGSGSSGDGSEGW